MPVKTSRDLVSARSTHAWSSYLETRVYGQRLGMSRTLGSNWPLTQFVEWSRPFKFAELVAGGEALAFFRIRSDAWNFSCSSRCRNLQRAKPCDSHGRCHLGRQFSGNPVQRRWERQRLRFSADRW